MIVRASPVSLKTLQGDDLDALPPGQRIGIVMCDSPVSRELGAILFDVIRRRGSLPSLHYGPDPELLDADRVILIGHSLRIDGLAAMLTQRSSGRPYVLVWQIEPLPPPGLTPLGESIGRRVVSWNWAKLPAPLRRALEPVVPFRTRLLDGLRWMSARSYRKQLAKDPDKHGWGEFNIQRFRQTMTAFLHLRDALDDGVVDHVVASTQSRFELLTRLGIPATFCPIGYHEFWGRDLNADRDIDVLYLGTLRRNKSRRTPTLRRIRQQLHAANRELHVVSHGCYGDERERLLNRSRIVLDIPRIPWDFAIMRLIMSMGCGAMCVSVDAACTDPFIPGEHFVNVAPDELSDRILYYLEHETERRRLADQGRRFVTEELSMDRLITNLLTPARPAAETRTS